MANRQHDTAGLERTELLRGYLQYTGRRATALQMSKVRITLEQLRRMCAARGIGRVEG